MSEEIVAAEEEVAVAKRDRKLAKSIDGNVVTITAIGGLLGEMKFDASLLPKNVQDALIPFGLSHKLGDSAAGTKGEESEEAINAVWDSMMKGEWSSRKSAEPKFTKSSLTNALSGLSPEEAEKVRALMASVGITL